MLLEPLLGEHQQEAVVLEELEVMEVCQMVVIPINLLRAAAVLDLIIGLQVMENKQNNFYLLLE